MMKSIAPTKFQQAVLRYRGHCGIINAGGRGSGKSFSLLLDLLAHLKEFGAEARPLVLRESSGGLQELQDKAFELCVVAFGSTVTRNKNAGTLDVPGGAVVTFACLGEEATYAKLQGRSFTAIYADELGNATPAGFAFTMRTLSNLRTPPGQRPALHFTCNPHGRSHAQVYKKWVSKAPPWHPFQDEAGLWWVWTTSSLEDNPHIDRVTYERTLRASCGADAALADAWIKGDWSVLSGCLFNFDPAHHIVRRPPYYDATHVIGADWGTAAPAVGLLIGRLREPAGYYRAGDLIVLDETDTADPNGLSVGTGAPVQMFAEMLTEMAARNDVRRPFVVVDDARGLSGDTVVDAMRQAGLPACKPYKKSRVAGWIRLNQLLHNAKTRAEDRALWVTDRCPHLIETIQEAPRGTLRAEDLDPKWNRDHWCDALSYGVTHLVGNTIKSVRVIGVPG